MVVQREMTALQTLDGITGSVTTGRITGKILSIKFTVGASTTFKIYTTEGVTAEYIFGASGTAATVATSGIYYPRVVANLNTTGAALADGSKYAEQAIQSPLTIDVVGTDTKTWGVEIIYEQ